jgi:toxin ParE1/3/4
MEVVWSLQALSDIAGIYAYVAGFNPPAAVRLMRRMVVQGDSLEHFPHRGRPVHGTDLRELTVIYPYIIRYRVEHGRVLILRVRHGRRRP